MEKRGHLRRVTKLNKNMWIPSTGALWIQRNKTFYFKPDSILVSNPLKENMNMIISTFSVTWLKDHNCEHTGTQRSNIGQQNPNKMIRERSSGSSLSCYKRAAAPKGTRWDMSRSVSGKCCLPYLTAGCHCLGIWDLLGMGCSWRLPWDYIITGCSGEWPKVQ